MGNDAVSGLVGTMPGITGINTIDQTLTANNDMVAGVSAAFVNITRDGVDASAAGRIPGGFQPATITNPDMVGEIRMITSPVDAELGRGNSQVQIQTRSGTNAFRGALVYNNRNSAVEPNTWANNKAQGEPSFRPGPTSRNTPVASAAPSSKTKRFSFFYGTECFRLRATTSKPPC